jgi:hypothetical protein
VRTVLLGAMLDSLDFEEERDNGFILQLLQLQLQLRTIPVCYSPPMMGHFMTVNA